MSEHSGICEFIETYETNKYNFTVAKTQVCLVISKSSTGNDLSWRQRFIEPIQDLVTLSKQNVDKKCHILFLVDELTLTDSAFTAAMKQLGKSIHLKISCFRCQRFQSPDNSYRGGLNGLMRFFPAIVDSSLGAPATICFKSNTEGQKLFSAYKQIRQLNLSVDFLYISKIGNEFSPIWQTMKTKHKIVLPYMDASTFCVYKPFDPKILTDFLDIVHKKPIKSWILGRLSEPLDHGIDDIFANIYMLPCLYNLDYTVAYFEKFDIATPFFYYREEIIKDSRSLTLLRSIFYSLIPVDNVLDTLSRIDLLFYNVGKASGDEQTQLMPIVKQFWKVLDIYPDWFPVWYTKRIMKFKGKLFGEALVVTRKDRNDKYFFLAFR